MNKMLNIIAAKICILIAVTGHPGLQPLLGSRQRDLPSDRRISHGKRILKNLAIIQYLWRDLHALAVEMNPHCALVHCAPHTVSRRRHYFNQASNERTQKQSKVLPVVQARSCGLQIGVIVQTAPRMQSVLVRLSAEEL
jgi:hypothetical protein